MTRRWGQDPDGGGNLRAQGKPAHGPDLHRHPGCKWGGAYTKRGWVRLNVGGPAPSFGECGIMHTSDMTLEKSSRRRKSRKPAFHEKSKHCLLLHTCLGGCPRMIEKAVSNMSRVSRLMFDVRFSWNLSREKPCVSGWLCHDHLLRPRAHHWVCCVLGQHQSKAHLFILAPMRSSRKLAIKHETALERVCQAISVGRKIGLLGQGVWGEGGRPAT